MNDFSYDDSGRLCCAEVPLEKIAREVGTPYYCYSLSTLRRHIKAFEEPLRGIDHQTCFAMKANSNLAILTLMANNGLGADVVSGGELFRAMKAGIPAAKIVYSGVGKTADEIDLAINAGIMMFNIESEQELGVINERARTLGKKAPISIRVNPDVDPQTHPYISTGMKQNKFGIDIDGTLKQYLRARDMDHLEIVGIAFHIGSQLTDISPFIDAIDRLKVLMASIKDLGIEFKYLDLGGGLGITYSSEQPPHPKEYGAAIIDAVRGLNIKLIFEPGRVIVGNAGVMVTRVLYRKETEKKTFIIVDAGMNDLIRPALYGAYHDILPLVQKEGPAEKVDIVGPICESSDFLAKERDLPYLSRGDLIAVMSAGAYGFTMASNYNSRPKPPEVLVDGANYSVVIRRQSYEDLISGETVPDGLI